jgi:hypothetical protein
MSEWHLAPSLRLLRREVDWKYPARSRVHDGSIGDAAHSLRRSDHNPDLSAGGVVRALDVTSTQPAVKGEVLSAAVGDPRVAYVIADERIWVGDSATWHPYLGPNPHRTHVHISIRHDAASASDQRLWLEKSDDMDDKELLGLLRELREDVRLLAQAEAARYKVYTARYSELLRAVKAQK